MTQLESTEIRRWRDQLLAAPDGPTARDSDVIDLIAELERVKAAACAAQADLAVALDASVRRAHTAARLSAARQGSGVAAQVALARHESPHRGQALLGLARDLQRDLPHTRVALREGRLSEYAAMLVARETGCLDRAGRAAVDAAICGDRQLLDGLGTRALVGRVRARVAAADPGAVARRARRAESERHVSLRPAPDSMTYLTALLPLAQGVASYAALSRAADSHRADPHRAEGTERSRGQVMADCLVERLTGQSTADAVPISVDLVISDATLLGSGSEPAVVVGHGPVPAQLARELVAASLDAETPSTWSRRVYADPQGDLVALTSSRRFVADGLAALLRIRDQGVCRTAWCDAPARHRDHVIPVAEDGATTAENVQSLCEACNYAKQAPGWTQRTVAEPRHTVETTTPTGHHYRSPAPAVPVPTAPVPTARAPVWSGVEVALTEILRAHAAA